MALSVPDNIWGTENNLDIHVGREGGYYLAHINAGDGPFIVVDHFYFGGTLDQPQDCYFKVKLLVPVKAADNLTYTEGWVIGCNSYIWKVRFTAPVVPPPPPPVVPPVDYAALIAAIDARVTNIETLIAQLKAALEAYKAA